MNALTSVPKEDFDNELISHMNALVIADDETEDVDRSSLPDEFAHLKHITLIEPPKGLEPLFDNVTGNLELNKARGELAGDLGVTIWLDSVNRVLYAGSNDCDVVSEAVKRFHLHLEHTVSTGAGV